LYYNDCLLLYAFNNYVLCGVMIDLISPVVYMVPLWQIGYRLGLFGKGGHPDRLSMDEVEFKKAFSFLMKKDKWVTQK